MQTEKMAQHRGLFNPLTHPQKEPRVTPSRLHAFTLERSFTHRLHRLSKMTDRISQMAYLAEAGIPMSEGRCLAAIGAFSPLSVNHLASQANLNKSQASRAVQSLVSQNLVSKTISATDGRGVVLMLTPQGADVWQRTMGVVERRNAEIMSCLDAAEIEQLDVLLDRLVAHAQKASQGVAESED